MWWFAERTRSVALVFVTLVVSTLALSTPMEARADSRSFSDGTTTPGSLDIYRVRVINEQRLTIRVTVDDLRRRAGQGEASAWIDTDPDRRGPEYFIGSGLSDSDWMIGRARDWQVVGNGPLNCPIDQRLLFDRDVIVWTTGPACLGRYSAGRVSVTTRGGGETDHSPARHVFHPWVPRF